jgi:hypothetical protein
LRALHVGASGARPIMGVRPDAPTNETIVFATFYEIINYDLSKYLCNGLVYIIILSRSSLRSLRALR